MTNSDFPHDESAALPDEPTGTEFDDDAELTKAPEAMTSARRPLSSRAAAVVGVRAIIGLIGISTATALVAGATFLPLPSHESMPPGQTVLPVPTAQELTCPGPLMRLSDDSGAEASAVFTLGEFSTDFFSSSGSVERTQITATDAETGEAEAYPLVLSAADNSQAPHDTVRLSAAQAQEVAVGEYVGLAAAACRTVGGDSWLVGGATTTGRTTLISLTNPSEVGSTVSLDIFDERGAVSAAGTTGIVVPPRGQRVLSLAGFAPGVTSPVVRVSSTGGQITAELQQSIVRGLDPGGVEIIGASVAPAHSVVIPALVNSSLTAVQALRTGPNAGGDVMAAIRVFVPGEDDATVSATLTPEDPEQQSTRFSLDLSAGVVTDIPLEELETGVYTVSMESDVPIVAAARVTSAKLAKAGDVVATDFAWFVASPVLDGDTQFTVAASVPAHVHVVNPNAKAVTVTLDAVAGAGEEFTVAGNSTLRVPVPGGASYVIEHSGGLYASVTLEADGLIGAYSVAPHAPGSSPLRVYP